ncbi:UNVERIFIED_CONTAM: hypothetical protein RMT77_011570 [Armadillidium vulgare]
MFSGLQNMGANSISLDWTSVKYVGEGYSNEKGLQECIGNKWSLPLPMSSHELEAMTMLTSKDFYLDLKSSEENVTNFITFEKGKRPVYTNWKDGQPNFLNNQFCVQIENGKFNDRSCAPKAALLCQVPGAFICEEGTFYHENWSKSEVLSNETCYKMVL